MSDHLLNIATAHIDHLADEADCTEAIQEIRNLMCVNPSTENEKSFNAYIWDITEDLEEMLEEQLEDIAPTPKPLGQLTPEQVKAHKLKMIDKWESYIEDNKIEVLVAEANGNYDYAKELIRENKQHRKDIEEYKEAINAL